MTDGMNLLSEYLRARRALVTPQEAGIPVLGPRRVPGLRREEVAMLSGISSDYYLRLEQGRDHNPSAQVLASIARVLQLDEAGTAYLLSLGNGRPQQPRRKPRKETVPVGIRVLVDTMEMPAFVEGRYFDVLAANSLATALSPRLVTGGNRLRDLFLDPAEQSLYPDWDEATAQIVARFRESVGTDVDDSGFVTLVGSLSLASPRFRELWGRHDVARRESGIMSIDHPGVGPLTLYREKLAISASGQMLVVYHADPGSDDADKLAILGSYALPAQERAAGHLSSETLRDPDPRG